MTKLLVMTPCREEQKQMLLQAAGTDYAITFAQRGETDFSAALERAEVILGEPTIEELRHAPNVKWVQMTWAGTDIYTRQEGFPKNVLLTNATGAFGEIISEYIIGAVLMLYRHFPAYLRHQHEGLWQDAGKERTLYGKRVLILGAGDIGTQTAKRLRPFGTVNIGMRRVPREIPECFDEMITLEKLDEQLPQADIVIGCLPNTDATAGLLGKERLLSMKQDALLLNVGRGTLIPLDDLIGVLQQGHLSGVTLDVFPTEPLAQDSPLWKMKNVLITPHIAGPSFAHEARTEQLIYTICCENLHRYAAHQPLRNLIDFSTGYRTIG